MVKKERSSKKSRRRRAPLKQQSIEEIIELADSAMEAMDVSHAVNLYESAATKLRSRLLVVKESKEQNDDNREKLSAVLGKLGEAKVSQGNQEGARKDFADAIALLTEQDDNELNSTDLIQKQEIRGGLYLYLGQLSSDYEALAAYEKGIDDFEKSLRRREAIAAPASSNTDMVDDNDDEGKVEALLQETRRQLSSAYCAVAELYLTDLCFDEHAESQCEFYVNEALKLVDHTDGQPLVDALQAAASLRLSQQRGDEAARRILQAYRKIEKGCKALAELVGLGPSDDSKEEENAVELVEVDAANNLPGFEFRCQTAKILLECAAALKVSNADIDENDNERRSLCVEASIYVLGSLLAENDEVVEIWYLTGCAFAAADPPDSELAAYYWKHALDMLDKVKQQLEEEVHLVEGNTDEVDRVRCESQGVARKINEITINLQQLDDSEDVWPMEDEE